jgi:hypothetical protein
MSHVTIDISRELTTAVPFSSGGKVVMWEFDMTYTNSTSGLSSYYVDDFHVILEPTLELEGECCWGLSAESDWNTLDLLLDIIPTDQWDVAFEAHLHEVFDPPEAPTANNSYVIPS